MTYFTPYSALLGGSLIGLSAALLLLVKGRIAGITGIMDGAILFGIGWGIAGFCPGPHWLP